MSNHTRTTPSAEQPPLFPIAIAEQPCPEKDVGALATAAPMDPKKSASARQRQGTVYRVVDIENIHDSDLNPRRSMDLGTLNELAASIAEHGILQAPVARPKKGAAGHYHLVIGSRRLAAARRLGLRTIEIEVIEATDGQARLMALAENLQRDDLSDADRLDAVVAAVDELGKKVAVAEYFHKSKGWVSKHVRVAEHPIARAAVTSGRIGVEHAYDLIAGYSGSEFDEQFDRALRKEQSHDETKASKRLRSKRAKSGSEQVIGSSEGNTPVSTTAARGCDHDEYQLGQASLDAVVPNTVLDQVHIDAGTSTGIERLITVSVQSTKHPTGNIRGDNLKTVDLFKNQQTVNALLVREALKADLAMVDDQLAV